MIYALYQGNKEEDTFEKYRDFGESQEVLLNFLYISLISQKSYSQLPRKGHESFFSGSPEKNKLISRIFSVPSVFSSELAKRVVEKFPVDL